MPKPRHRERTIHTRMFASDLRRLRQMSRARGIAGPGLLRMAIALLEAKR